MRRNSIDGSLDIISPVELLSGGFTLYIQAVDQSMYLDVPEEFAGPFQTEDEALQSGYRYLDQWEAELQAAMDA